MGFDKFIKSAAGGVVGGVLGGGAGAVHGVYRGAVNTVSLSTKKEVASKPSDTMEVDPKPASNKFKIPGLAKTVMWGGVAAVATAIFALSPASWPVVGFFAAKAGLVGPLAGFVAGATARAVKNVVLGGFLGGLAGAGLGGAGGALYGANGF